MPNPKISKIKLPDNTVYDIRDVISGYLSGDSLLEGSNITITESSAGFTISSTGPTTVASVSNHILSITNGVNSGDGDSY